MLIEPRTLKSINGIQKIQLRLKVATFNGNHSATIISCYSPTNVNEEIELVAFYDELSSLVRSIPKHNVLVIGGDMNALIRKNGNHKFSLHYKQKWTISNRFHDRKEISVPQYKLSKREGKLWIYTYTNNCKVQRDYVLINKKWNNYALNCETYSSFDGVSSDHRILTAKIRLW